MNRKISILFKGIVIFAILFSSIYFTSYTCSEAGLATQSLIDIHYERGVRFYKEGQYESAISELESVLYIDANHKKAKKYLQIASKRHNKKIINKLYREANDYYKQREFEKALDTYQKVLSIVPDDGYSLYKIELLKSRIEKEIKLREREEYRKRVEELERLSQEGLEEERIQKKLEILELERQEKERRKIESERKRLSMFRDKGRESDMVKDLDKVQNLLADDEKIALPDISVFSKKKVEGKDIPIDKSSEKERIKKVKSLYKLGKEHYRDREYRKAILIFQEVIDLEVHLRKVYTPYAERYIKKAKNKAPSEISSAKVKEVEEIESEMINKVIEAAKVSRESALGITKKETSLPIAPQKSEMQKKLEIPVNMDFQNVDVVYVLDYLTDVTGANIVMSSAVAKEKRNVSIKIKDMPLEEGLKYVLKSAGLNYRIDKNVIWVATPEEINNEQMETKVFSLKKGKGAFTQFTSFTTGKVGLGSAADIDKEVNIKDIIKKAISWPAGSKIVLDERLGALIVTNTPYNLEIVERILNKIDVEPIQILIETRFLEVTVTDLDDLGIDWPLNSDLSLDKTKNEEKQAIATDSRTSLFETTRQGDGFNLTYQGVLTKPQFQFVLNALEESQKVKTLSAPCVTTLDNQMATMKVVDEWIYPTRYEFQVVQNDKNGDGDFGDTGETQYKNVPSDFVKRDVGILLRVTPSVGLEDNTITLTLIPEVSEGKAGYFSYTGDVTLPLFTSRNISTSLVINNGDTVMLGGLVKETQTKVEKKVPLLGDIPWLGSFFRKETDNITRKNLLIFVTASVLSSSGKEVALNKADNKL